MPKNLESDTGEIPLVDDLESEGSEIPDDSEIPLADVAPASSSAPMQPLQRIWKHEPDEEELAAAEAEKEKNKKAREAASAPARAPYSVPVARPKKSSKSEKKKSAKGGDDAVEGAKKPLVEETPALDTYESRQRVRMIVGGLLVLIMVMLVWTTYRIFLRNAGNDDIPAGDLSGIAQSAPEPKASLDQEASFMLGRAAESAKQGRTDQAIAMLKRVVKVYPKTAAGMEAQSALDRPKRNLPMFLDRPAVVAVPTKTAAPPPTPPPSPPLAVAAAPTAPAPTAPATVTAPAPNPAPAPVVHTVAPANMPAAPTTTAMPPQGLTPAVVTLTPPPLNTTASLNATAPPRMDKSPAPKAVTARMLPNGFRSVTGAGLHESGWPLMIASERDLAPMVFVPGATFTMGNDRGEPAEGPSHPVRLSSYYIDQHEVTCGQFRIYLEKELRSKIGSSKWFNDEKFKATPDSSPMVMVNYREADSYALWAGKRLPTEAQWEMAGRSFESKRYPWGDDPPRWSRPRQPRQVTEVKTYPEDESVYGAFDLAGNAMEWTRDWFDPHYFDKAVDKVTDDPAGPLKAYRSIFRVVKGGSKTWALSAREGVELDKRLPYLSFRCVLAVEGPDAPASIVPHPPANAATPQPGQGGQSAVAPPPF